MRPKPKPVEVSKSKDSARIQREAAYRKMLDEKTKNIRRRTYGEK